MVLHAVVSAHQGGWDEALFVITPVAIFVVLFRVARARAEAQLDQDGDVDGGRDPIDPQGDR